MKTPEQIAQEIVDQFSWSTNVSRGGRLVGQQYVVAQAIAAAIQAERDRCADIPEGRARGLINKRRTNQVDRHTAYVLKNVADDIRGADHRNAQED